MREQQEFVGTLRGFDDFMNVVLEDVKEYNFIFMNIKYWSNFIHPHFSKF